MPTAVFRDVSASRTKLNTFHVLAYAPALVCILLQTTLQAQELVSSSKTSSNQPESEYDDD